MLRDKPYQLYTVSVLLSSNMFSSGGLDDLISVAALTIILLLIIVKTLPDHWLYDIYDLSANDFLVLPLFRNVNEIRSSQSLILLLIFLFLKVRDHFSVCPKSSAVIDEFGTHKAVYKKKSCITVNWVFTVYFLKIVKIIIFLFIWT